MRNQSRHWKTVAAMAAGALVAGTATAQSLVQTSGTALAATDDLAPGSVGSVFGGSSTFDHQSVAETGYSLFRARMVAGTVVPTNERAYFYGSSRANLSMLIRGGDPAPGLPGVTLNTATAQGLGGSPRLSPDGDEAFFGSALSGAGVTTSNDTAIFSGPLGSFSVLVREGDPAVGTAGATYSSSFSGPSYQPTGFNRSGRVLFQSSLVGGDVVPTPSNNAAWYSGTNGALELVQRKGDVVLGGAIISALGFVSQMNDAGQVLHDETLSTTLGTLPATAANDRTLWIYTPGSGNTLLVREGDPAPGTVGASFAHPTNSWFVNVGANAFNSSGQALMVPELFGGDVSGTTNNTAIYRLSTSGHTLVVRKGDPAPGFGGGETLSLFHSTYNTLNNAGRVAFKGQITGGTVTTSDDTVLYTGLPGSLTLVAREGQAAPGTVGATFAEFVSLGMFHLNELGQVSFLVDLTGGDTVPGVNDSALYAWDPNTGMHLVVRDGDSIEVQPGVFKTPFAVGNVQFNNGDANPLGWNKYGRMALNLTMTDSTSALFTVDIPTIPTPLVYCTAGTTTNNCNATISASAQPSVTFANACNISVANVEGQKSGIIYYGFTQHAVLWCVGGSSFLCVKSPTQRTPVQDSGGTDGMCNGTMALDWNAYQMSNPTALGNPWSAGNLVDLQAWFRDPSSCKTTSLSNAVQLLYQP